MRRQAAHWPSRATTRPPLITSARGGRMATSSPSVSPGTITRSARQPTSRPYPSSPRTSAPPRVAVSSAACSRGSVAEAAAIGEQHGALQHVRRAERRPGVAHTIRSREHRHTGRAEAAKRRHRPVPGRIGHDGDALSTEQVDEAAQLGLVDHAEAKRVADRDLARESRAPACARRSCESGARRARPGRADGCPRPRHGARRCRRRRRAAPSGRDRCRRDRCRRSARRPPSPRDRAAPRCPDG